MSRKSKLRKWKKQKIRNSFNEEAFILRTQTKLDKVIDSVGEKISHGDRELVILLIKQSKSILNEIYKDYQRVDRLKKVGEVNGVTEDIFEEAREIRHG